MRGPRILVFDSGLGGLTVLKEIVRERPDAEISYVADTGGFPYGALTEKDVVRRVLGVMETMIGRRTPDIAVIACNTASTLVLPHLRAAHAIPFVGTVPAIKPAAETTESRRVSVLATPGTVRRDYTRALIDTYAFHIDVKLVAAQKLAGLAEAHLRGDRVKDEAILSEIRSAFVNRKGRRTDTVVLACTHYPLLLARFEALAPWPVAWIDPAPAIARRAASLLEAIPRGAPAPEGQAVFTGERDDPKALAAVLKPFGLGRVEVDRMGLRAPV